MPFSDASISFLSSTGRDVIALDGVEHVPEQLEHVVGLDAGIGGRAGRSGQGRPCEPAPRTKAEAPMIRVLRMGFALGLAERPN